MSNEEKNFYYFKLHDSDNNDVLDGLELLQAATHHQIDHTEHNLMTDYSGSNNKNDEEMNHIIRK